MRNGLSFSVTSIATYCSNIMSTWSLRWHFTNKSVTGAPYSIKSYKSLPHSWTLWWSIQPLSVSISETSWKLLYSIYFNFTYQPTTRFTAIIQVNLNLLAPPVKNWRILLVQSFTARMPLLMATSTLRLGRRRWSYPQQCHLHCLCTFSLHLLTSLYSINSDKTYCVVRLR